MENKINIEHSEIRRVELKDENYWLTMKTLRRFVESHTELPDNTPILQHRIEDTYFSNHGWGVVDVLWDDGREEYVEEYVNGIIGFNIFLSQSLSGIPVVFITPHY